MAIRKIVERGDEVLSKKSRVVTEFDDKLAKLIEDMYQTLEKADGMGLAAVQIGILKRVIVINSHDTYGLIELVNPEIISVEGGQIAYEGCLSVPGYVGKTVRPRKVKIKAQDRFGEWHEYEGEDLLARCFCHETDHLNGILYIERLAPGARLEENDDD